MRTLFAFIVFNIKKQFLSERVLAIVQRVNLVMAVLFGAMGSGVVLADSPELALREFASGQVKKGVRSIGFGGDGATWGNYGLVWKDAGTGLLDAGETDYTNGNVFQFAAVGATSPQLWHGLSIYMIALKQRTDDIQYDAKTPGFGTSRIPAIGEGGNEAQFVKVAMPLGNGFSAGVLLSHERSDFTSRAVVNPANQVHYNTEWRPSGGFGVAWQPDAKVLVGFRALFNRDMEERSDATGTVNGIAKANEYRLGASYAIWDGALLDIGGTRLYKSNAIANKETLYYAPNIGFEQSFNNHTMAVRFGLDESSPGAGFSAKFKSLKLDLAYIHNLGEKRIGDIFGTESNSLIMTLNWDYQAQ